MRKYLSFQWKIISQLETVANTITNELTHKFSRRKIDKQVKIILKQFLDCVTSYLRRFSLSRSFALTKIDFCVSGTSNFTAVNHFVDSQIATEYFCRLISSLTDCHTNHFATFFHIHFCITCDCSLFCVVLFLFISSRCVHIFGRKMCIFVITTTFIRQKQLTCRSKSFISILRCRQNEESKVLTLLSKWSRNDFPLRRKS